MRGPSLFRSKGSEARRSARHPYKRRRRNRPRRQRAGINPTAIFCSDRKKYYEMLSIADSCRNDGVCAWCDYMLQGLWKEVRKIERLSDKDFVQSKRIPIGSGIPIESGIHLDGV